MSDIDFPRQQAILIKGAHAAPIVATFGMRLEYNSEQEAVWRLPFNKNLTNGLIVHGGAIATLLDNAGWFTIAQYFQFWIATVEFQTRLVDFVKDEELVATGHIVRVGKKISTATMEVISGDGRKIAIGSGTYSVTSVPLPYGRISRRIEAG